MGAKLSELVLQQLVSGSKKLRFLGRLDQANRCKTCVEDPFGINDALISSAILYFQILDSFVDATE